MLMHPTAMVRFLFLSSLSLTLASGAAAQSAPVPASEIASWPEYMPGVGPSNSYQGVSLRRYQTQAQSGEDWVYDMAPTFAGSQHTGYVYAGYASSIVVGQNVDTTYTNIVGGALVDITCYRCTNTSGCGRPKLYKTDAQGNRLWYHIYGGSSDLESGDNAGSGELYSVIQTSDGGYLAVGYLRRPYGPVNVNGDPLRYSTPSGTQTPTQCPSNYGTRRTRYLYAVKVSANGALEWEQMYGSLATLDIDPGGPSQNAVAWDVVEVPGGGYRVVGEAPDASAPFAGGGGYIVRAFVMGLGTDGAQQWLRFYGSAAQASMARGIAQSGSSSHLILTQYDKETAGSNVSGVLNAQGNVSVIALGAGSSPAPVWSSGLMNSGTHEVGFDVVQASDGSLIAVGTRCAAGYSCWRGSASGAGTLHAYRLSVAGSVSDSTGSALPLAKAFDFWATLEQTTDSGTLLVSSVQDPMQASGLNTRTDAYITRLDANLDPAWARSYDARTSKVRLNRASIGAPIVEEHPWPRQECLYAIVRRPGATSNDDFFIVGNNSSNFDDNYVVHFSPQPPSLIENRVADYEHVIYHNPSDLTFASNTVEPDATMEGRAPQGITLSSDFVVELGGAFVARTDSLLTTSLDGTAPPAPSVASDDDATLAVGAGLSFGVDVWPTPAREHATLRLHLPQSTSVVARLYDALGRTVRVIRADASMEAGVHRIHVDLTGVASGVYLVRVEAEGQRPVVRSLVVH